MQLEATVPGLAESEVLDRGKPSNSVELESHHSLSPITPDVDMDS